MSFNWTDFLTLAEALAASPDSLGPAEAALRSAASRAYYAAFHESLAFAAREGFVPYGSGEDHKAVQRYLRQSPPTDPGRVRKKVAEDLGRLYDCRRRADYDNSLGQTPHVLAKHSVALARSILGKLRSLP
ncbi:MAG: hypothetical protein Kow00123_21100 [Anaerolineales bacterium]